MEDHHVDRPQVEARQRAQLSGPNRPNDLIPHTAVCTTHRTQHQTALSHTHTISPSVTPIIRDIRCSGSVARWPSRGCHTRSHPELGRETPQRPWYCIPRCGRVGRRRATQPDQLVARTKITKAPWLNGQGAFLLPRRISGLLICTACFQHATKVYKPCADWTLRNTSLSRRRTDSLASFSGGGGNDRSAWLL